MKRNNQNVKKKRWIMHLRRSTILVVQESQVMDAEARKIENDNPGISIIINNGEHSHKLGTLLAIN